jgi:hypothetical protein
MRKTQKVSGFCCTGASAAVQNGDGKLDLVVANASSNSVSVLLSNGNGTFQSAVNFAVGTKPASVAVADVNGDGRADLVVADAVGKRVSVLLGNGNGTFQSAVIFATGSVPISVAVTDVNGDGIPDLVVANFQSTSVSVLLGIRNAATHFTVKAPASVTAGKSFIITVTALTKGNQLDAVYTGSVHFTSSDSSAVLPADYTFTMRDAGSHNFTVTLNTTGSQTITVTDKNTSSITGQATVTVGAAPPPGRASGGGESAEAAVSAAASQLFRSWDRSATLPASYPFVRTDAGTHPVSAVLTPAGSPTITATERGRRPKSLAAATVPAAVRVGLPFDPEAELLSPAGIEAYFAQNGLFGIRNDRLGQRPMRTA